MYLRQRLLLRAISRQALDFKERSPLSVSIGTHSVPISLMTSVVDHRILITAIVGHTDRLLWDLSAHDARYRYSSPEHKPFLISIHILEPDSSSRSSALLWSEFLRGSAKHMKIAVTRFQDRDVNPFKLGDGAGEWHEEENGDGGFLYSTLETALVHVIADDREHTSISDLAMQRNKSCVIYSLLLNSILK